MKDSVRRLVLDLPASHASVRVARNVVSRFARLGGVPSSEIDGLRLVTSELLANAVDHGGNGAHEDADASVGMGMVFELNGQSWTLTVHDQGGGDLEEVRALIGADMPDLESERGRGFFLLETMLDDLAVDRSPDGLGLSLAATKSFHAPE